MNLDKVKEGLDLPKYTKIMVTKVTNGFNIRIKADNKPKIRSFNNTGPKVTRCAKCGEIQYCHDHHIIPISAGGKEDDDNRLPLCFNDHVGNNGIHNGKWKVEDIVPIQKLHELQIRYNIIKE